MVLNNLSFKFVHQLSNSERKGERKRCHLINYE